jgi:hypothetical protein
MDCIEFRTFYKKYTNYPIAKAIFETEHYQSWQEHNDECSECSDWCLIESLKDKDVNHLEYPCVHMAFQASFACEKHKDKNECSHAIIIYDDRFDEYFIGPRGGGGDYVLIKNCPFCGTKLPESKRDRYFDELDANGFTIDNMPSIYLSGEWFKKKT